MYYKVEQVLLLRGTGFYFTKRRNFYYRMGEDITNWGNHYKVAIFDLHGCRPVARSLTSPIPGCKINVIAKSYVEVRYQSDGLPNAKNVAICYF